jgi:alkylhydroperoxidase family enzyme
VTQQGLTEELYAHVAEYRDHPGYSDQERVAIEYAERFVVDHRNIDDDLFSRLRVVFTDAEVLDLNVCIAVFLGLGRILKVLGVDETCMIDW